MKRVTLTAILIAILVGGIVFVNLSGFGTSILSINPQASNGNGNGNSGNGSGGNGNNGNTDNWNGNGGSNDNGNGNGGNGGNDNGGSGGSNGNNGNGNSGTGNNGNGNGNNENNGNDNNGNANGSGNGNGNSNGNNGNGNNGSGNNGYNGNSGTGNNGNNNGNNGAGSTNTGNSGNGNNDNGHGNQNGNGNTGSNGNSGNGNGGGNDNSGNGNGNNNGNNGSNGNEGNNGNNGNGSGGNGNGNGGSNGNGNGNQGNGGNGDPGNGNSGSGSNGNGDGANNGNNGNGGTNNGNSRYKISGYILDSTGNPIAGAQIIYCVPDIVPAQFSDKSGYYQMNAPAGQYQIDVWPPFNSHYIFFEQKYLTVNSDMQMNITLQTGYRLSGIITTSSGAPVSGAVVWLDKSAQGNHYFCGWYSKDNGSYFVTGPAGTYTLKIQPKTGLNFPSYSEVVTITGDLVKNIVIGSSINSQDPNAAKTSILSLSVGYNSLTVGSMLHLSGKLLAQNGIPLVGKTIILSYAVANTNVYTQIGSGMTDSTGLCKIDWFVPASGTFTLKVEWVGSSEYFPASSTTALTFSA